MAELMFEKLYTSNSAERTNVCIGNEPDNTITKFFIEAQRQGNTYGAVTLSNYDNISWQHANGLMTSQNVTDIGIKTFPQIGAIGFYKLKYETRSLILAPIYTRSKTYAAPTITVQELAGMLRVTLAMPQNVTYDCFRVVVRNGYFAEEYVTYESVIDIPTPTVTGIYAISAFGYIEERLASAESVVQYIPIEGLADDLGEALVVLSNEKREVLQLGDTIIRV